MDRQKQHKMFVITCDVGDKRQVTALDCERCHHGTVIDARSRVMCGLVTKFFMTPCGFDMRSAATLMDCADCKFGKIGEDRIRVYCSRMF